jgi:hypothetical protein
VIPNWQCLDFRTFWSSDTEQVICRFVLVVLEVTNRGFRDTQYLLQSQHPLSICPSNTQSLDCDLGCDDEANDRSVRVVRANTVKAMRRTGPLQPPNPGSLQSEPRSYAVASWRPGRHHDLQLLTSSQIESTSPPRLSLPSILSPPLSPHSRQKHSCFPLADTVFASHPK